MQMSCNQRLLTAKVMKSHALSRVGISAFAVLSYLTLETPAATDVAFINNSLEIGLQNDGPLNIGLDFIVNSGFSITVDAIGAFDSGANGIFLAPIQVSIFDRDTGNPVPGSSVTFSTGDAGGLLGSYTFKAITPISLNSGNYSIVAANYGNTTEPNANSFLGNTTATTVTAGGALSFPNTARISAFSGAIEFPTITLNTDEGNFSAGNFGFSVVPEPSTYGFVMGLGLLGLGVWRRHYSK